MNVRPYMYFNGRAEEAIDFYCQAIGAEKLCLMRFAESPDQSMLRPGTEQKVMHASIRVGESEIMVSDGMCNGEAVGNFAGITLSITANDDAEAQRLFAALSEGGQVQMPLVAAFFASQFGMVADKFGVSWMVIVPIPVP